MPRPRDDSAAASAAALSATGATAREIGAELGRDERTVRRWLGAGTHRPGPRGRADITTAEIVRMRDADCMSWRAIAASLGMSPTGARKRYGAAKHEEHEMSDATPGPALAAPGIRVAARITVDAMRRNGPAAILGDLLALRPGPGREDRLRAAADRMAERGEDPAGVEVVRAAIDGRLTPELVAELRAAAGEGPSDSG